MRFVPLLPATLARSPSRPRLRVWMGFTRFSAGVNVCFKITALLFIAPFICHIVQPFGCEVKVAFIHYECVCVCVCVGVRQKNKLLRARTWKYVRSRDLSGAWLEKCWFCVRSLSSPTKHEPRPISHRRQTMANCVEYSTCIRCGPKCKCKSKQAAQKPTQTGRQRQQHHQTPIRIKCAPHFLSSGTEEECVWPNLTCVYTQHLQATARSRAYTHARVCARRPSPFSYENENICRAMQIPRTLWIFVYLEAFM